MVNKAREKRIHSRTLVKFSIQLNLADGSSILAETNNVSEGGIAVSVPNYDPAQWHIGMVVDAQVQDLPVEAPLLSFTVVRVSKECIGMAISSADSSH